MGILEKIRRASRDTSTEQMLELLHSMGVEAELVEIIGPSFNKLSEALPSRASSEAYDRIAKHVRNFVGR